MEFMNQLLTAWRSDGNNRLGLADSANHFPVCQSPKAVKDSRNQQQTPKHDFHGD